MVTVRRRYKGVQIEVIVSVVHRYWWCEDVRVCHDPHQTPISLPVRGTFADVIAAVAAGEARAKDWIDGHGATSEDH